MCLAEPVGDRLIRLSGAKLVDYVTILPVATNGVQDDFLPITCLLKAFVLMSETRGRFEQVFVLVLEAGVGSTEILNFPDEVILVHLDMRLIDAVDVT